MMKWSYCARKLAMRIVNFDPTYVISGMRGRAAANNVGVHKALVLNNALHEAIKRDNKARRTVTT